MMDLMVIELQGHSYLHYTLVLRLTQQKVILEEGTVASGEEDVFYAEEQNIIYEDNSGVVVTERFLADDKLRLTLSTTDMSPWVQLISQ